MEETKNELTYNEEPNNEVTESGKDENGGGFGIGLAVGALGCAALIAGGTKLVHWIKKKKLEKESDPDVINSTARDLDDDEFFENDEESSKKEK